MPRKRQCLTVLFSALFIAAFLVLCQFVFLTRDDYSYGLVSRSGLGGFFNFQITYYLLGNGRAVVQLLITAFMACGVYLWRIVNPFMLFAAVFFAAKCADSAIGGQGSAKRLSAVLAGTAGLVLCIDVFVMRETVLWLSGSLNYLYPVMMLFITYYFFDTGLSLGKKRYWLIALAFFAGATMEQAGAMAVGSLALCLVAHIVRKTKIPWTYPVSLAAAVAGYLTVVLAPGSFARLGDEGAPLSMDGLSRTFSFFMLDPASRLFVILFTVSVMLLLAYLFFSGGRGRRLRKTACAAAFAALCAFMALYALLIAGRLDFSGHALRMDALVAVYVLAAAYALISFFRRGGSVAPLAFFLAAFGGIAMFAAVRANSWYRTFFGPLFALIAATVIVVFSLAGKIKRRNVRKYLLAAALLAVCVAGAWNYAAILRGYIGNSDAQARNIQAAAYVRENAAQLRSDGVAFDSLITPLPDGTYAFGELSGSAWFIVDFMKYYGIYEKIDITADQTNNRSNRVYINGAPVDMTDTPMEIGGQLYVPLRDLIDNLNAADPAKRYSVQWDNTNGAVSVLEGGATLFMCNQGGIGIYLGDSGAYVPLSAPEEVEYGRAYLPVDAIRKGFGIECDAAPNDIGGYDIRIQT